jgi:hypothetical protein
MKSSPYPRCSFLLPDNTQCSRRVGDGTSPPVCHIHRTKVNGGGLMAPIDLNEMEILKKLARDSNPQVRLRAVDLLLSLKREARAEAPDTRNSDFLKRATPAQRDALRDLLKQIAAIKTAVLGQPAQEPHNAAEREYKEQARPRADATTASGELAENRPAPASQDVRVWRDGALITEPRAARDWKVVNDL